MRRLVVAALVMACVGPAGLVRAADKGDPTGTWKWVVHHGGQDRELSVKLKREGDRLTGSMPGRDGQEIKVEEGTYKNGEVSFAVPGKTRDGKVVMHRYSGKLEGDTIKGKVEIERDGEKRSGDWEAKRSKN
jgi:hypothetical protein